MIRHLSLRRFKRFRRLDLDLGRLTVLTGLNSAGKTTVIHALLLLRQAATGSEAIALNGPNGLALGEALDVLHRGSSEETIELSVRGDGEGAASLLLDVPSDRAMHLNIRDALDRTVVPWALSAVEPGFTYLCAERHGPRDTLAAEARRPEHLGVGVYGQHTAQVLDLQRRLEVREGRLAPLLEGESKIGALRFMERQAARWLSHILGMSGVVGIDARWIDGTSVTTLRFQMPGQQAEWIRPNNIGFGVSYVLPIVVAGLQAPPDGMVIIENPEAHLHPAGQSAMGEFLVTLAADGVQVVVETHSDHVINGIRRAIAGNSMAIDPAEIVVAFFREALDEAAPFETIQVRPTGELSAWPRGFFDQIERDLGAMARARRGDRRK
jgi:predicted ATPase